MWSMPSLAAPQLSYRAGIQLFDVILIVLKVGRPALPPRDSDYSGNGREWANRGCSNITTSVYASAVYNALHSAKIICKDRYALVEKFLIPLESPSQEIQDQCSDACRDISTVPREWGQ